MNIREAINIFKDHQLSNLKRKTQYSYGYVLKKFDLLFADRDLESITAEDISRFLESIASGASKSTRRLRYAQIKAFFNYILDKCLIEIKNPCSYPLLSKQFKAQKQLPKRILDKEIVDELIYKTTSSRDRLILELQARCGLRIGEVLKLKMSDVSDRKLTIREPKSGKDTETAFMPEQIAKRLMEHIKSNNLEPEDRLFPICYSTVRSFIKRIGAQFNMKISPHDFRRYSATFASRNGVPLEIVSKVFLRHHDLKTTQVYLGKIDDSEAIRWMDILHGK